MTAPDTTAEAQAWERLSAVVALLNSDLDLPQVLRRICDAGRQLLDGFAGAVMTRQGTQLQILLVSGAVGFTEGLVVPYQGSSVEALDLAGVTTMVRPTTSVPPMAKAIADAGVAVQTYAITQIPQGRGAGGALYVFFEEPDRVPSELDLQLLELLAGHASAAIANAEAYSAVVRQRQHEAAVIEAMADGLALIDAGGVVLQWNAAAAALTGRSAKDTIGLALPFPYPTRDGGADHQLPNGRWVEVLRSVLPGPEPAETVVTFRDITAAKMVEEAKNLFLATAGHELRSPLTVIRGFADTLTDRWDELTEAERQEAVRIIGARADGLGALIEQVLMSSQVEVGARRLDRQSLALEPMLTAAAVDVRSLSDRHVATVVVPSDLPSVLADEQALRTILGHLVDNAVKYSPAGGRITLSGQPGEDAATVSICVDDEGIGVASEDQERVFDRFFQADGGDTRPQGGFGLGLYIVRRLVRAHDGTVVMIRRPDGLPGTRVEVCLPVGGSSPVGLSNRS